jgi:hypothetical protein
VNVSLKILRDDSDGIRFRDLFNSMVDADGNKNTGFVARPHVHVVDSHGHSFVGLVKSDDRAEFGIYKDVLFRHKEYVKAHQDLTAREFKIKITNPDRRAGQPRSVLVQLR